MKTYKKIAIKTSTKPVHVHDTMFIRGEYYEIRKHPRFDDFCLVKGRFQNRLGGSSVKEQGIHKETCKQHFRYAKDIKKCSCGKTFLIESELKFVASIAAPGKGKEYKCPKCEKLYWTTDASYFIPADEVSPEQITMDPSDVI